MRKPNTETDFLDQEVVEALASDPFQYIDSFEVFPWHP